METCHERQDEAHRVLNDELRQHLTGGPLMEPALDIMWRGISGLAGGVIYLLLKTELSARRAVTVCIISVLMAVFLGRAVAQLSPVPLPPEAIGLVLGIAAIKIGTAVADGTVFDIVRKWLLGGRN
jgi:VIT1/CCC1 family predicted Fe2+/Mn2+ transporter